MGSDVAGIARYGDYGWEVANGSGADSLMMANGLAVVGILPMYDVEGEVYAFLGDQAGESGMGSLWWSPDSGDSWTQIGSDAYEFPPGVTSSYDDDIAGSNRNTNCSTADSGGVTKWAHGGGLLITSHSIPAQSAEVVYLANSDAQAAGVSVYDPALSTICPLENTGTALPAEAIGGLLRVDALPYETPTLVVGYRAREDEAPAIYVCELPAGGVGCSGGTPADCQALSTDLLGVDVRDMEWDEWSEEIGGESDAACVLIADGGWRLPDQCDASEGLAGLHELWISDATGPITLSADAYLADSTDLPEVALGHDLTGVSMDPLLGYVFLHAPQTPGSVYARDRAYRVLADQLLDPMGAPEWEPLNSGTTTDAQLLDPYEEQRMTTDLDLGGAWLESEFNGRAGPFPARAAPGVGIDSVWLTSSCAALNCPAAIHTGNGAWLVWNLNTEWTQPESVAEAVPDGEEQAEGDVTFEFWPNVNVGNQLSYQTNVVPGGAVITPDGHIWSAAGDQGLLHLDATTQSVALNENGSEVDCLWNGWHAGAKSVAVAERVRPLGVLGHLDPVVWGLLGDQSGWGYPHEIGVVRTMDQGASWQYAAAGWGELDGTDLVAVHSVLEINDPGVTTYGHRVCIDEEYGDPSHAAVPFGADPGAGYEGGAHAFSLGADLDEDQQITTETLGMPNHIRALNDRAALVMFGPTDNADPDTCAVYETTLRDGETTYRCAEYARLTTAGGLYLTTDGGVTWEPVPFADGGPPCSEEETYEGGSFELIHPGVDSTWEGTMADPLELSDMVMDVLLRVVGASDADSCSLARVIIHASSTSGLAASWEWYELPWIPSSGMALPTAAPGDCGVSGANLSGAVPAPWSNEAMLTGDYYRHFNGTTTQNVGGGACLIDLDATGTATTRTVVVDPRKYVFGIQAPAPHPQIADLWLLMPELGEGSAAECMEHRSGSVVSSSGYVMNTMDCGVPYPLLARGNASGMELTSLTTMPPTSRPNSAMWSELHTPDDSADGEGSWIVVATQGSGTWRGEVSW